MPDYEVKEAINTFNNLKYYYRFVKYLTDEDQMEQNRICLANQLLTNGWDGGYLTKYESLPWTVEAIAGLFGNIQSEDQSWNPDVYQGQVYNVKKGYGFVQWTPATKYQNWVDEQGLGYYGAIENQCYRFGMEANGDYQQWVKRYGITYNFYEYTQRTDSPEDLAKAFYWCYEFSAIQDAGSRPAQARKWYNWLIENMDKIKPSTPTTSSKFNFIYYLRRRRYG
jgi:hypothetical protein